MIAEQRAEDRDIRTDRTIPADLDARTYNGVRHDDCALADRRARAHDSPRRNARTGMDPGVGGERFCSDGMQMPWLEQGLSDQAMSITGISRFKYGNACRQVHPHWAGDDDCLKIRTDLGRSPAVTLQKGNFTRSCAARGGDTVDFERPITLKRRPRQRRHCAKR